MNRINKTLFQHKKQLNMLLLSVFMMFTNNVSAAGLDLDDTFFRAGKYYVVVAVLVIMFLALFIFLFRLDRKVTKLENDLKNEN